MQIKSASALRCILEPGLMLILIPFDEVAAAAAVLDAMSGPPPVAWLSRRDRVRG